jgi:hypothetical protein
MKLFISPTKLPSHICISLSFSVIFFFFCLQHLALPFAHLRISSIDNGDKKAETEGGASRDWPPHSHAMKNGKWLWLIKIRPVETEVDATVAPGFHGSVSRISSVSLLMIWASDDYL